MLAWEHRSVRMVLFTLVTDDSRKAEAAMSGGTAVQGESAGVDIIKKDEVDEAHILDLEPDDGAGKIALVDLGDIIQRKSHRIITHLILDHNDLTCLPSGFVQCFPRLIVFSATGNNLQTLPEDFGRLTCLENVDLTGNQLTALPCSVQFLANVRTLKLTSNNISSLPMDFGEMSSLEELHVDFNQLTRFPPTFALLAKLRVLEGCSNKLSQLPKYLGSMSALSLVNLSKNCLEQVPCSFCRLQRLTVVDLSKNKLTSLPLQCASQKTMKRFYADNNVLNMFPQWLGHCPELTELSLRSNLIEGNALPDDMGLICKKLQKLDLAGNKLTELPSTFGGLDSLEDVHLGSDRDIPERRDWANGNHLQRLPQSFTQLKSIRVLRLDENQLLELPSDFGSLKTLEVLNLAQNILHDLPESFGQLSGLRECNLSRNSLTMLPCSFGCLLSLVELHVDNNQLGELPESFVQLKNLRHLDLYNNRLSHVPTSLLSLLLDVLDLNCNPLKMPKRLVPNIHKGISYITRTKDLTSSWRGRMRMFVPDIDESQTVSSVTDAEDDTMADEEVDPLYGPDDIPYNCRFKRLPTMESYSTWRTHSGPQTRPLLLRDGGSPSEEAKHIGDGVDGKEEASSEDVVSSESEAEEDDERLSSLSLGSNSACSWGDSSPQGAAVAEQEEDWEKEIEESTVKFGPYSVQDLGVPEVKPFQVNPALKGHSLHPFDLHAPMIFRPKYHDPAYQEPKAEAGQFSDSG